MSARATSRPDPLDDTVVDALVDDRPFDELPEWWAATIDRSQPDDSLTLRREWAALRSRGLTTLAWCDARRALRFGLAAAAVYGDDSWNASLEGALEREWERLAEVEPFARARSLIRRGWELGDLGGARRDG